MKGVICILALLWGSLLSYSQTTIAEQSFETSGDTWTPLTFSTPPCNVDNDVWDYVTSLPGISSASDGTQFWGIRDLNGNCGGNGFETITFPNIDISSNSNVTFAFDYYTVGMDNNDDLKYELFYDNVSQGEVIFFDGIGGNSDNTNGWITETVSIPNTVNQVSLILSARSNQGNDRAGFDHVRLFESVVITNDDCAGAQTLTVHGNGASSGNETNADTSSATPSSMADNSCDSFTSNENLDLFYNFTVPAGQTSINVLTGGATGSDINVAVWDACNGNEVFCDNTDASFHQITDLTPGVTYILQVWHDDFNAGQFTIALEESAPPPSNTDCSNATSLIVGTTNTENVVTGTNENATSSGELPNPTCGAYNGRDVWFTAHVPGSGILIIETQDAGSGIDTAIAAYSGSCGNLSQLNCNDDISYPGNLFSRITLSGIPNTTVYIRVWAWNNASTGNFNIVAYSPECPFSTTWNGSNWNNGAPNEFTSVTINGDYTTGTDGSFDSCNCTVNSGDILTVSPNTHILVDNDLTVNGTLEVEHEGSLVMVQDDGIVSATGTININKTSTPFNQFDYMYWSSPTENETIGSALASSEASNIYRFDIINGWVAVNGSTTMDPGVGYIAMGDTSGTFPKTQSVVFDGVVNTGTITTPLAVNSGYGYNLIGNPYPSAIRADRLLMDSRNTSVVNATIYLWTHNTEISESNPGPEKYNYTTNDYATFTAGTGGVAANSGGAIPNGFIASGQGFFIEATTAGDITYDNSMRVTGNNNQLFRGTTQKATETKDRIWLDLENDNGAFSQLLVGFIDGATDGIDRNYDGLRLNGGSYISFYSIAEDKTLAVQGKKPIADEEVIKLGFSSYINERDSLRISINNLEGHLNEYNIYLKDHLLGLSHDLTNSDYQFVMEEKGVFDDRFEMLLTKSSVLGTEDLNASNDELILINREDHLEIKTTNHTLITSLKVFDILGKTIVNTVPDNNTYNLDTKNMRKGTILLVNTTLENNQKVTKKFLVN